MIFLCKGYEVYIVFAVLCEIEVTIIGLRDDLDHILTIEIPSYFYCTDYSHKMQCEISHIFFILTRLNEFPKRESVIFPFENHRFGNAISGSILIEIKDFY